MPVSASQQASPRIQRGYEGSIDTLKPGATVDATAIAVAARFYADGKVQNRRVSFLMGIVSREIGYAPDAVDFTDLATPPNCGTPTIEQQWRAQRIALHPASFGKGAEVMSNTLSYSPHRDETDGLALGFSQFVASA